MKKESEKYELLIAVEVATKGVGLYLKNNWDTTTSFYDPCRDYVNLAFYVIAKKKENGDIYHTHPVKTKDELNDLDYYARNEKYRPTKITRLIPYSPLAVKHLNYIVGDLKGIAAKLTELFAKKPNNTTKALEKLF